MRADEGISFGFYQGEDPSRRNHRLARRSRLIFDPTTG
jgi:hypothetical protein